MQGKDETHKGAGDPAPDQEASVHVIMGSKSDLDVAYRGIKILENLGIPYAVTVASAHRTPDLVKRTVKGSSADVFIAIAGLSAALPGAVASLTMRPVIGVPVSGKVNMDSILSIVQMPPGIPVGCVGLDRGDNAALQAIRILAISDPGIRGRLEAYMDRMREKVIRSNEEISGDRPE